MKKENTSYYALAMAEMMFSFQPFIVRQPTVPVLLFQGEVWENTCTYNNKRFCEAAFLNIAF